MKERILEINPKMRSCNLKPSLTADNIGDIICEDADYVVDAIDTVSSKIALVNGVRP